MIARPYCRLQFLFVLVACALASVLAAPTTLFSGVSVAPLKSPDNRIDVGFLISWTDFENPDKNKITSLFKVLQTSSGAPVIGAVQYAGFADNVVIPGITFSASAINSTGLSVSVAISTAVFPVSGSIAVVAPYVASSQFPFAASCGSSAVFALSSADDTILSLEGSLTVTRNIPPCQTDKTVLQTPTFSASAGTEYSSLLGVTSWLRFNAVHLPPAPNNGGARRLAFALYPWYPRPAVPVITGMSAVPVSVGSNATLTASVTAAGAIEFWL